MGTPDRAKNEDLESLTNFGRRCISASAAVPGDALRFLGTPTSSRRPVPGAAPGEMVVPPDSPRPEIRVMVYGPDGLDEHEVGHVEELRNLTAVPGATAWIDVEGFGDPSVLSEIGDLLGIHPLAMADVVHVPQRPKA